MSEYKNLPIPAEIYDDMGIDEDPPLQFDYDEETQTLHVSVLTQDDLDSLAGYKESDCGRCAHVSTCPDAHGTCHPCEAFIDKEDTW